MTKTVARRATQKEKFWGDKAGLQMWDGFTDKTQQGKDEEHLSNGQNGLPKLYEMRDKTSNKITAFQGEISRQVAQNARHVTRLNAINALIAKRERQRGRSSNSKDVHVQFQAEQKSRQKKEKKRQLNEELADLDSEEDLEEMSDRQDAQQDEAECKAMYGDNVNEYEEDWLSEEEQPRKKKTSSTKDKKEEEKEVSFIEAGLAAIKASQQQEQEQKKQEKAREEEMEVKRLGRMGLMIEGCWKGVPGANWAPSPDQAAAMELVRKNSEWMREPNTPEELRLINKYCCDHNIVMFAPFTPR